LYLCSSPGGLFSVGAICCFCFGAGVFCSSALFPGWSSCGYYAVVGLLYYVPLVGGVVALLHCFHCEWLVVFVVSVVFLF